MRILPKCILIFFILSLFQTAHARLPSPPTRQEAETRVQRLRGHPAGIRQNPSSFLRIFLIE